MHIFQQKGASHIVNRVRISPTEKRRSGKSFQNVPVKRPRLSESLEPLHFCVPLEEPKSGGTVLCASGRGEGTSAASRIWSAPIGLNVSPGVRL
mmetsp:Transcript_35863/g.78818  ORF Transcript_35863/g.78818 Transcript_35863/m.78818 type:complete len:94 (+) Transcript_35863:399-680(+)